MLLSALLSASAAYADVLVTIDFKNEGPALKDLVHKVRDADVKITGVDDKDGFQACDVLKDGKILKCDGGNIAKNETITLKVRFNKEPSDFRLIGDSKVDKNKRGTSAKDDIFSTAIFGGLSGTSFAGVSIPANQYGYFYQFDRNALFGQSPDQFEILIGSTPPTAFGFLPDTWPVSLLANDLPQDLLTGTVLSIQDHMTPDFLTGMPGVNPTSWSFSGDRMIARYSQGAFQVGDVASVLWFIDPLPPEVGGPLGTGENNAFISAGNVLMFTNSALAPSIPEPSTILLLAAGLGVLAICAWRGRVR